MKKLLLISLIITLIAFITFFCLHKYLLSQIYPAPKSVQQKEIKNSIIISIQSEKRFAHGVYIHGNEKLLVLFHGNGSSLHEMIPVSSRLINQGFSVLFIEYPGYWLSKKETPNESNILYDSTQLINYIVKEYGYNNKSITLLGYSLGGAVAISLAANHIGSKLITIDTFTSMDDIISQTLPIMLTHIINTEKYDNMRNARSIKIPVLLIHGDHDNYIPYAMSDQLCKQFPNAELIPIKSNNHATILSDISDDNWVRIIDFIKR